MGKNERKKNIIVVKANYPWIIFNNIWMKTFVTISCIVALFSIFMFKAFIVLKDEPIRSDSRNSSFDPGVDIGVKINSTDSLQKDVSLNTTNNTIDSANKRMSDKNDLINENMNKSPLNVSVISSDRESENQIKSEYASRARQFNSSSISDNTYPTIPFVACECARPQNDLSFEHAKIECAVEYDESASGAKSFSPKQIDVDGLKTMQGYLSEEEQNEILEELSNYEFSQYIGKTCLEFGHNYSLLIDNPTSEFIPPKLQSLADRLVKDGVLKEEEKSNHILVNRYSPGQGIPTHVDDNWWTDGIVSITLLAGSAIEFKRQRKNPYYKQYPNLEKKYQGNNILECGTGYFDPGSLFAMHGESRYAYGHEIKRREKDRAVYATKNADGKLEIKSVKNLERKTRISLGFRRVKDEATKILYKEGITGEAAPWLFRNKYSFDD